MCVGTRLVSGDMAVLGWGLSFFAAIVEVVFGFVGELSINVRKGSSSFLRLSRCFARSSFEDLTNLSNISSVSLYASSLYLFLASCSVCAVGCLGCSSDEDGAVDVGLFLFRVGFEAVGTGDGEGGVVEASLRHAGGVVGFVGDGLCEGEVEVCRGCLREGSGEGHSEVVLVWRCRVGGVGGVSLLCSLCGGLQVLGRWVWSGRVVVSGSVVSVALVLLGGDLVFGLALEE